MHAFCGHLLDPVDAKKPRRCSCDSVGVVVMLVGMVVVVLLVGAVVVVLLLEGMVPGGAGGGGGGGDAGADGGYSHSALRASFLLPPSFPLRLIM